MAGQGWICQLVHNWVGSIVANGEALLQFRLQKVQCEGAVAVSNVDGCAAGVQRNEATVVLVG